MAMPKRSILASWLEEPTKTTTSKVANWTWSPLGDLEQVDDAWGSGRPTNTNASTYEDARDSISDSDRPNEGVI